MGATMTAYFLGSMVFGGIGFVAFVYGKKMGLWKTAIIGILLMLYTLFVYDMVYVYGIGIVLTIALFVFKD